MGQQNKRSSLSLSEKDASFYNIVSIDTASARSITNVHKRFNSTPTPVNNDNDTRRRSKSSLPAVSIPPTTKESPTNTKGYMKGRRPRKEVIATVQQQEGEADQSNHDEDNISIVKKRSVVLPRLFKKSTKASSPTSSSPVSSEESTSSSSPPSPTNSLPTTTASGKKVKITGAYVHSHRLPNHTRTTAQQQKHTSDRLRSKSSPVIFSSENSLVVGGYLHKRGQNDALPQIFLTLTPPTEESTTTPHLPKLEVSTNTAKCLIEDPYVIVLDDYTTYMEMPLTKKNGIIIKKKKEKLKEMVQVYHLQRDELVNRTRREMAKSKRRR